MTKVHFSPEFPEDLANAVAWYSQVSQRIADQFREAVQSRLRSVGDFPESYALIRETFRVAPVLQFPYLIVFEIADDAIHVLRLVHGSRHPNRWLT